MQILPGYDSNSVGQEDMLYHTLYGDLSQYRYIIAEMADFSQIVNILENQVWLMPEKLKAKLAGIDVRSHTAPNVRNVY